MGGIILASIGDFIGRKKMFAFTLLMLAVLIGLLPGYAQIGITAPLLLLCRLVQGISIGGELPGALVCARYFEEKSVALALRPVPLALRLSAAATQ